MRAAFAHYIKDIYKLEKIGKIQGGSVICMDVSMFTMKILIKFGWLGLKIMKFAK